MKNRYSALLLIDFWPDRFGLQLQISNSGQRLQTRLSGIVVKGKVVSADKANHKVTIAHEEIKGYMEAMTMPFTLLDDWVYPELKTGSQIQATLVVDQGRSWLEERGRL